MILGGSGGSSSSSSSSRYTWALELLSEVTLRRWWFKVKSEGFLILHFKIQEVLAGHQEDFKDRYGLSLLTTEG